MDTSRRALLALLAGTGAGLALGGRAGAADGEPDATLPPTTGLGPNPYWGSVGPYVTEPQKLPLIRLTDRPVQLETPRRYLGTAITPNEAFYVRWHLPNHPTSVDLATWKLSIEGAVDAPLALTMAQLLAEEPSEVVAVNQCSGNSRSRFEPRVPGGQWGNGAVGCARWTGVPLRRLLDRAKVRGSAVQVQLQGLDTGNGPEGKGSHAFLKSLKLDDPVLDRALVAYAMNGEPLPLLNGFPARLVVPGYFATYWVKSLAWIRLLEAPDENFWMKPAYMVPDTPDGSTTPEDVAGGKVVMKPISVMPVRSFLVAPDGETKLVAGMPVVVRGVAFSGTGPVKKVEWSADGGATWADAKLGEDLGPYAFRTFEATWKPPKPGTYTIDVRATDAHGTQPDHGVWNPGGYLWNKIERQDVVVGAAGEA